MSRRWPIRVADYREQETNIKNYCEITFGELLEVRDTKINLDVVSLLPLRSIGRRLNKAAGESYKRGVVRLRVGGRIVTLNISGRGNQIQIQGLKGVDDLPRVKGMMQMVGLHVVGVPRMTTIICQTEIQGVINFGPIQQHQVWNNFYKVDNARIYFHGGRVVFVGSSWGDIEQAIDVLGPLVLA